MDHATLKARQRALREQEPLKSNDALQLRVHRALSWLEAAEGSHDPDTRFLFLWIAFNAAYATDIDDSRRLSEQEAFGQFLQRLLSLDTQGQVEHLLWNEFSDSLRNLLQSKYLFADFWRSHAEGLDDGQWRRGFDAENRKARNALATKRTRTLLGIALSRVYVLRNQLVHGGATWQSQVNREQLRVSSALLGRLVPCIISLLLDHPGESWPAANYPVVDDRVVDTSPRRRGAVAPRRPATKPRAPRRR